MTYQNDTTRISKVVKTDKLVTWTPEFNTHFCTRGKKDYLVYQVYVSTYHTQPTDKRRKSETEIRVIKETFRGEYTTFAEADNAYRFNCLRAFGKLQSDIELANLLEGSEIL